MGSTPETIEHFEKILGDKYVAMKVCLYLHQKTVTVGQLTRTVLSHLQPGEIVKVFKPLPSSESETEIICNLARSLANHDLMHGLAKLAPPRARQEIAALLAREYAHTPPKQRTSTAPSGNTPPQHLQGPVIVGPTPAPQPSSSHPHQYPPHGGAPASPPLQGRVPVKKKH
ncbi:MAG TPA: hypothetical protein VI873_03910 [Candidatus Peribacteraceae bacterium]|nr:hypothetical protein [Candidatus Peribacteraceae bacterium]